MSDGTLCDACSNFHKRSALYTSSATSKPAKNSSPTTSDVNAHHGTGVFFFGVATGLSFLFVVLFFLFKFFSFLQQRTTPISDGKTRAMHVGACNSLCSSLHSVNPIRLASPPGGMGSPPEGEPCTYIQLREDEAKNTTENQPHNTHPGQEYNKLRGGGRRASSLPEMTCRVFADQAPPHTPHTPRR